jgi:cytochrome c
MGRAAGLLLSLCFAFGATTGHADDFGDPERGKSIYAQCQMCHQVGKGAEHRIGPHLNGLFGRKAGAMEDYTRYSPGLVRAGADGMVWTFETLDVYIQDPRSLVSGTRMNFGGISTPEDRHDLLAYLREFSASPANIPEAEPTAAATNPDLDPEILAIQGDPAYGEYLSGECTTCHQADGSAQGIPAIVGWPTEDFVLAMHAYKRKLRPHPVMQMMASRLSDEEIAALAAYFSDLQ